MNELYATINKIQTVQNVNLVTFDFFDIHLTMMSLGLSNVKVGSKVLLCINPSNVSLAKDLCGLLSDCNEFKTTVVGLEIGELLCSVQIKYFDAIIHSLITASSAKKLNLCVNDEVTVLLKASELSIKEIL